MVTFHYNMRHPWRWGGILKATISDLVDLSTSHSGSLYPSSRFECSDINFSSFGENRGWREYVSVMSPKGRSQWPRGLRRRSTAARLLRSWVRIPLRAWMFVCCECCVLSGRGLCDGLVIRSEESYRLWRVVVCDHETSQARRLKPARGL